MEARASGVRIQIGTATHTAWEPAARGVNGKLSCLATLAGRVSISFARIFHLPQRGRFL
jgi:hypothetical protein